jgi:glycosyltransferase involved in cell wall biosynthesis
MGDTQPKRSVAVVVPVYNRLPLLRETVASLKSQTLQQAEFILVDDRSEDDVWDYLTSLAHEDSRFRIIRKPVEIARGCQASRNIGLDACTASSVMFLDSDDLLSPDCLQNRYEVLEANPTADAVVGRQVIFSESDKSFHWVNVPKPGISELDRILALTHPIDVPWVNGAILIRKESLDRNNIRYRPEFEWEDVAFHFECLVSGLTVLQMPFPGPPDSFYRLHGGLRMGEDLFSAAGMRSAAKMFRWMCARLSSIGQLNSRRREKLAVSLFQACILRSIDAADFSLAKEMIHDCLGLPLTRNEALRLRLYLAGRRILNPQGRKRYYWDRTARRILIPEMFPKGPSTYGTIAAGTRETLSKGDDVVLQTT